MGRVLQLVVASEAAMGGLMNPMMGTKFVAPDDQKANWTQGFCEARVNADTGANASEVSILAMMPSLETLS